MHMSKVKPNMKIVLFKYSDGSLILFVLKINKMDFIVHTDELLCVNIDILQ